jgi:hypothetical protein
MAWAVIAVIMLHSLLEYPLWYGPFQMALGLSVWLLWHTQRPTTDKLMTKTLERPYKRAIAAILLIALIMTGIGFAAWEYTRVSQLFMPVHARLASYRDNTLQKVSDSPLFQSQVEFAALSMLELAPENAAQVNQLAKSLLHFSPEPRVIERLIESAELLKRADEAAYYRARYQAAFPEKYDAWAKAH